MEYLDGKHFMKSSTCKKLWGASVTGVSRKSPGGQCGRSRMTQTFKLEQHDFYSIEKKNAEKKRIGGGRGHSFKDFTVASRGYCILHTRKSGDWTGREEILNESGFQDC